MKLYVRKGRAFVNAEGAGEVYATGVWCDEEGTYESELDHRTEGDKQPCRFRSPFSDVPCSISGPHKHWDHYGYECRGRHTPVAIVSLEGLT